MVMMVMTVMAVMVVMAVMAVTVVMVVMVMMGGKDGSAAKRKLYDGTAFQGKGRCVRRMEKPGRRGDVDGIYNATKVKPLRLRVITYSLPNNCGVTSTTQPRIAVSGLGDGCWAFVIIEHMDLTISSR